MLDAAFIAATKADAVSLRLQLRRAYPFLEELDDPRTPHEWVIEGYDPYFENTLLRRMLYAEATALHGDDVKAWAGCYVTPEPAGGMQAEFRAMYEQLARAYPVLHLAWHLSDDMRRVVWKAFVDCHWANRLIYAYGLV